MAFKDDIRLDITALDKAALNQPELYEEWSGKWAEAMFIRDKAKEALRIAEAEADEEIRKNPVKFGWDADKAPTESWYSRQIVLHDKVRDATEALIEAQYDVNVVASAKEVLEHRKKSLDILTELFKQNYFVARSREDKNYSDTVVKKEKEEQLKGLAKKGKGSRA